MWVGLKRQDQRERNWMTGAVATTETGVVVLATEDKAEGRDKATRSACVSARHSAGDAGEGGYFKGPPMVLLQCSSLPAQDHCRGLRAHRLRGKNPGGVECG